MNIKKKCLFVSSLAVVSLLGSCNKVNNPTSETTSSPTSINVGENNYYNESNFEKNEKVVTETKIVTYDGPKYLSSMEGIDVKVNDTSLFVYETRVNRNRKFSWEVPSTKEGVVLFDFEGKVHIEVTLQETEIKNAYVSPLVYGIAPSISNNVITFDLEYADNYVLQYVDANNESKALHIFASTIEENPLTEEDAKKNDSIIYIGPGVYKADALPVKSNSTIYLAGGAYVYGQIRTEGLENITIRGRGIISGSIYTRLSESDYTIPVEIRSSNNIKIEDITFLDPAGWTIALYKSKDIEINNIRIISARQNGDGISVQSCENVNVNKGFVRTWDDSLVVKNVDRGSTNGVHFNGVYVWTDLAQSMEVGYETYGPTMNDITFDNITVIHNYHKAAISLHNCDDANITNVKYTNITIEDASMLGDVQNDGENDFLIDFTIAYSVEWTKSQGKRGSVDGVTIDNVKIYSMEDSIVSRMLGESNDSMIKNVAISNIEIENKNINSLSELKILNNNYVSNVTYKNTNNVLGAKIKLPYALDLKNGVANITTIPNIEQVGMLVPSFAKLNGELPYIGVPANISATTSATHGAGNKTSTPADDGSGDFTASNYSSSAVIDNDNKTTWKSAHWKNEENEFAALTVEFDKLTTVGVIRILGNQENDFFYTYDIQVWGRRVKTDGTINDNYTRLAGTKEYQMSPGSGNCIDINVTTQEYKGLQLRLYRSDSVTRPENYEISEILFYPPSLSFNKAIVDSTEHNDVYNVGKLVDGDATGTSYYESKSLPATIVIDLGDLYLVNTFVLSLPPSLMWDARTEVIEISYSASNLNYDKNTPFTTIVEAKPYLFDPATGNRNIVTIEPTSMRYVKIVISSNDTKGGYNAQLSEFSVYGEQ